MDNLIYGINGFQTRSLVAQENAEEIRFFVGTQVLNQKNQIHLLELDDSEKIKSKIFEHDEGEIWKLTSSPNEGFLASVYSNNLSMKTAILKIPDNIFDDDNSQKEMLKFDNIEVLDIESHQQGGEIKTTEFHSTNNGLIATVTDSKLLLLNRTESETLVVAEVNAKNTGKLNGGKWYNANQFIVMHENGLKSYDTRDNRLAFEIPNAHLQQIRDIDINPNKAFTVATVGDDSVLKIWDVRNNKTPVFSRRDHQHWIFSVSFNKFHDQLILTSGSDGSVLLTCAGSCSSESTIDTKTIENEVNESDDNEIKEVSKKHIPDGLLEKFDHHEDSVYCAEWSADPWYFCSVSWDGRVVIKKIPKKYKYQILL